jgi:glycyl-tRNA synthetase beta chain
MTNLIIEIGCEEIPSRFIPGLLNQIHESFTKECELRRLPFQTIQTFGTYRRLIVSVKGLSVIQDDMHRIIKGPPSKIALDSEGKLTQAALGFLRKNDCLESDFNLQTIDGSEYICVRKFEKGQTTLAILPDLIRTVFMGLSLPIAMTWGRCTDTFIRPVQWVCVLFGTQLVPLTLFSIQSAAFSYGHRTLSEPGNFVGKKLQISDADSFFDLLFQQGKVVWDQSLRKTMIRSQLAENGQNNPDEELLNEVVFLVESPEVLTGAFESQFLQLPVEVLVECMKKHQRYFPIYLDSKIKNEFLLIADNVTERNKVTIVKGNEKVLVARLKDADFFWNEDRKQPLISNIEALKGIVFQKNLGSIYDKCTRISKIAIKLAPLFELSLSESELTRIAYLIKADLVSHMVFEFPSLQGVMGAYYAIQSGESEPVATAIREHYMPLQAASACPSTALAALFAVSDRLDTLVASFSNGNKASGSQDPLGLRRAANGCLVIFLQYKIVIKLEEIVDFVYALMPSQDYKEILIAFLTQRVTTFLSEQGLRYDEAAALTPIALESLSKATNHASVLQQYRKEHPTKFKQIVETAVRLSRLAKKGDSLAVNSRYFVLDIEAKSYEELVSLNRLFLLDMNRLYDFSNLLVSYFEEVLVMSDDEKLKVNRLAFIRACELYFSSIATFESIVFDA